MAEVDEVDEDDDAELTELPSDDVIARVVDILGFDPFDAKDYEPAESRKDDAGLDDIVRALEDIRRQIDEYYRRERLNLGPHERYDQRAGIRLDATYADSLPSAAAPAIRGAGLLILYRGKDGDRVLFVRHKERDTWELPGGRVEESEAADEAAMREVAEELGATAHGSVSLLIRNTLAGVDYSTFLAHVDAEFEVNLDHGDGELIDAVWASPASPPDPLHPGVRLALDRLRMNELDIARAIASGEFSSPQQYENIWLFALRITGTGISYRQELKEYVWRPPEIYLSEEFLARCAGLPVVIEHPPTDELTTEEYTNRIIGSITFAYIEGDEVWGIGKIYDQRAANVMRRVQLSTSPAVIFRDPSVNETRKLEGGKTLLVEGDPSLLDHLAICELGVWDKDGSPTGVAIGEPEMADGEIELPAPAARADSTWPWLIEVERLIGPLTSGKIPVG